MEIESGSGNSTTFQSKKRKYSAYAKPVAKNGKIDADALNKKLISLQKQIKTVSGVDEVRFKSTSGASTLSSTGVIVLLNGMSEGDSEGTREGVSITLKSYTEHLQFITADATNVMRRILVWDKQTNGAAPALSDILEDSTTLPLLSPKKWENRKRFQFLKDDILNVSTYTPQLLSKLYLKLKGKKTNYLSNVNTSAGITSGGLYLVMFSDSGAATHPAYNYFVRMTYTP